MKYFFLSVIFLICLVSGSEGQTIIRSPNITAPPAPAGTSIPIVLNTGPSVEYLADNEIILKANSSTDYFWVQANTTGGAIHFLAAIVPINTIIPYGIPIKSMDGGYYRAFNHSVFFKFIEEYFRPSGNTNLVWNVYDYTNTIVMSSATTPLNLNPATVQLGDNRYNLNVTSLASNYYMLEVFNVKGEKWFLRFKVD
jgi:hypothetical protein